MAKTVFKRSPTQTKTQGNRSLGRILLILLGLLLMGYGIWFVSTHTLVETKARYTPIEEAAKNPYFAASLMLKESGKSATFLARNNADNALKSLWQDQENASAKSVILTRIGDAQESSFDEMTSWVLAGGQLIVFTQSYPYSKISQDELYDQEDSNAWQTEDDWESYAKNENPFLIYLGIYNAYEKYEYKPKTVDDWEPNRYKKPIKLDDTVAVIEDDHIGQFDVSAFIENYGATINDHQALGASVSDEVFEQNFGSLSTAQKNALKETAKENPQAFLAQSVILDAKLGKGSLVVLDMSDPFANPYVNTKDITPAEESKDSRLARMLNSNDGYSSEESYSYDISQDDNAFLLNYLTQERQEIFFVPAFEQTDLWTLMNKNLPFMLFAFGAIGLLTLLSLPRQFGRREVLADDSAKNVLAYYSAIGHYLWQSDACVAQVEANRERLYERMRALLPVLLDKDRHKDQDVICQLIAKDSGLMPNEIFLALYSQWTHERAFVEMSRAFARLAQHYA